MAVVQDPALLQRVAERHQQHIGTGAIDALGQALARRRKFAITIAHADHLLPQGPGQRGRSGLAHARTAAQQKELQRLRTLAAQIRNQVGAIEVAGKAAAVDQPRSQIQADPVVDDTHAGLTHAHPQRLALHDEIGIGKEPPPRLAGGQCMK